MRISQRKRVAVLATLGVLALPATAFGAAQIQERPDGLADFDVRLGAGHYRRAHVAARGGQAAQGRA